MESNYIVLREQRAATRDVFRGSGASAAGLPSLPSPLRADVFSIERRELARLADDASVVAVAPAMPMRLIDAVRRVPFTGALGVQTWGIGAVGADTSPRTGNGVVVAVLDTGIDDTHPAFAGVELVQKDFTGEGNGDLNGHGTHCAGTIFGQPVNGMRIGVAPGVRKALIGKVLGQAGGGSSDQIVRAIQWAVDEGAHVISMSLGMDFGGWVKEMIAGGMPANLATSRALEGYRANTRLFDTLADHIKARGLSAHATIIVAAAGNESRRDISGDYEIAVAPPAVSEGIISVAALGESEQGLKAATFSNTGANLSAPGVDVISAEPGGGLRSMSGTSMATPHVAGVAALWAERLLERGRLDVFTLTGMLAGQATSEPLAAGFDPFDVGAGLVQCPRD
jgi:subtilisin family serine protease